MISLPPYSDAPHRLLSRLNLTSSINLAETADASLSSGPADSAPEPGSCGYLVPGQVLIAAGRRLRSKRSPDPRR